MTKAIVSAVVSGYVFFVGMEATHAGDAIPADLQAQFNQFLIERNIAAFLARFQPTGEKQPTTAESGVSDRPLIRLAAAGPDFPLDMNSADKTAAVRAILPAKPDCVLPTTVAEPPVNARKHFEIGDKLKLVFVENVQDVEKNKWGNAAGTGFEQHPELSGEYMVQDDGTVSVPVLGSFDVTDVSPKELQNLMAEAFNKVFGRNGFVTIVSVERPPIYILGPVKSPGSYTYSPGMTVLHAVTLAGGFPREDDTQQPWQKIERVRETSKRYTTLEALSELLTREAVLKAQRDHAQAVPPQKLIELVGQSRAASMIAVEQDRQRAAVAARNARLQAVSEAINVAQQQVYMLTTKTRSIESMDANIAALKSRAAGIDQLYHQGALNNSLVIDTKSRVAEAERQRQDMIIQVSQSKDRVVTLQGELAKTQADIRVELDNQILEIDHQIADANRESTTSEGVLGALQVQFTPPASAMSYEIVRQTPKGPVAFTTTGMSTLIPGDLVQISTTEGSKTDPNLPGQPNRGTTQQATVTWCR